MAEDQQHLSTKLQSMKFMQRSATRAKVEEEKRLEQKLISESHWTATYDDSLSNRQVKPKQTVVYESSYLKMPETSSESGVAVGRRSFNSFNKDIEQLGEESVQRQKDELVRLREEKMSVDEDTMAQALYTPMKRKA